MIDRLINYLKGTRAELKQVNWPTRSQTMNYTLLVIGASAVVAIFLGAADQLFAYIIEKFILKL